MSQVCYYKSVNMRGIAHSVFVAFSTDPLNVSNNTGNRHTKTFNT